jgi:ABC-type antimicrobial peptide transport system permease subunit
MSNLDLIQGTLHVLVLRSLAGESRHGSGWELVAELARASISDRRFNAVVLATFAAAALALALVGTYGVFSYWVSNQRRELGIRMAMGAAPGHIVRLVLGKSAATVLAGLIAGTVAAVLVARTGASLLYGVAPTDPLVFLSACTLLAAAAFGASWLPARRAAAVEPVETLTSD